MVRPADPVSRLQGTDRRARSAGSRPIPSPACVDTPAQGTTLHFVACTRPSGSATAVSGSDKWSRPADESARRILRWEDRRHRDRVRCRCRGRCVRHHEDPRAEGRGRGQGGRSGRSQAQRGRRLCRRGRRGEQPADQCRQHRQCRHRQGSGHGVRHLFNDTRSVGSHASRGIRSRVPLWQGHPAGLPRETKALLPIPRRFPRRLSLGPCRTNPSRSPRPPIRRAG